MPEYTDYFDPFVVENELPLGYECDPFARGQDVDCSLHAEPALDVAGELPTVDADTNFDADQGEGN